MMDYYILQNGYPNQYEQFNGFTVELINNTARFELDKSVKLFDFDFIKSINHFFIGSAKLCEILNHYNPAIRLKKCEGFFANHQPLAKSYFIVEYSQVDEVMDYWQSDYVGKSLTLARLEQGELPQLIRGVRKLVVNQAFANDLHYFFLKNTLLSQPVISQMVLDDLLKSTLKISVEKIS